MSIYVGVDVGGTFTDFFIVDDKSNVKIHKRPTVVGDEAYGIVKGLEEADVDIPSIKSLIISTTVATNALTTMKLPRVALITTKGFRDIIEIRKGIREDIWDSYKDPAPPIVKRRDRFAIDERVNYKGDVIKHVDIEELKNVLNIIKKREIKAIAIHYINSFINPINEIVTEDYIRKNYPDAYISRSSEIDPEIYEFERASTTVINVALMPVVENFFTNIRKYLNERKFSGSILIVHSGGGAMTPETAKKYPARLAGSGPTVGAIGAMHVASASASSGLAAVREIAKLAGLNNFIGVDSGGTTTLVSMQYEGKIRMRNEWWINFGHPIRFQSPEVITIGAGGGSVAWLDEANSLHVGPDSMAADPGPACYGKQKEIPTLTDANVVTSRLNPKMFLGGKFTIYPELSYRSIENKIAKPLNISSIEEAAEDVIKVAVNNMANAVGQISIGRGYDPREFVMISFGGSGPLHAALVAKEIGISTVLIPRYPGIVSAMGTQLIDIRLDISKTIGKTLEENNIQILEREFNELEIKMAKMLENEGFSRSNSMLIREMDLMYRGQWRSLTLEVPKLLNEKDIEYVKKQFHEKHLAEYNFADPNRIIEVLNIRVIGIGIRNKVSIPKLGFHGMKKDAYKGSRKVFYNGAFEDFNIYDRDKLGIDSEIEGPAIIEQMDSTVLVPPETKGFVDEFGNIILNIR